MFRDRWKFSELNVGDKFIYVGAYMTHGASLFMKITKETCVDLDDGMVMSVVNDRLDNPVIKIRI